jgi:hypothetical protein
MPHLVPIYKNDFVKDIARILPLTSLAVCQTRSFQQTIAFTDSRQTKRCAARGEARVAEGKGRFLNRNRCVPPTEAFATSPTATC